MSNLKPVCGFSHPGAICARSVCGSDCCSLEPGACDDQLPDLHLSLKGEYFEQIVTGDKPEEYRLATPYWRKRLEGRSYGRVIVKRGYPKADDQSRISLRKWQGAALKVITHQHFGPEPVEVFAIDVSQEVA